MMLTGGGALAVAAGLTARGQVPAAPAAPGAPQYYQGRVSPPPPGMFPGQPGSAPATPPVPSFPTNPAFQPPVIAGKPAASNKPRLSTPVMAGAEGVRQVGARESVAPPNGTPPFFTKKSDAPPEPKPLAPPALLGVPAPPVMPNPEVVPAGGPVTPLMPDALPAGGPIAPSFALPSAEKPEVPPGLPVPTTNVSPHPAPTAEPAAPPMTPQPAEPRSRGDALPSRAAPAVSLELLAPETVGVGQALTYELVVKNSGPTAVTGVRVEDELPPQSALISSEPAAESAGERLAFTLGTLEAGGERRVKITVKPGEEGELRSRATVSHTSAVEGRVRVTRPRVAIALSGPESARTGQRVPFTIKLTNSGSGPAGRVQLQAKFSDGLVHAAGPMIETELKELAAGQTRTFNPGSDRRQAGGAGPARSTPSADGQPADPAKATVARRRGRCSPPN